MDGYYVHYLHHRMPRLVARLEQGMDCVTGVRGDVMHGQSATSVKADGKTAANDGMDDWVSVGELEEELAADLKEFTQSVAMEHAVPQGKLADPLEEDDDLAMDEFKWEDLGLDDVQLDGN